MARFTSVASSRVPSFAESDAAQVDRFAHYHYNSQLPPRITHAAEQEEPCQWDKLETCNHLNSPRPDSPIAWKFTKVHDNRIVSCTRRRNLFVRLQHDIPFSALCKSVVRILSLHQYTNRAPPSTLQVGCTSNNAPIPCFHVPSLLRLCPPGDRDESWYAEARKIDSQTAEDGGFP